MVLNKPLEFGTKNLLFFITSLSFTSSQSNYSLFIYHYVCNRIVLLLYVDDIIVTFPSPVLISRIISYLSSEFPMSDLVNISFLLEIVASRTNKGMLLSHTFFAKEIVSRSDMSSCNPCSTPSYTKSKPSPHSNLVLDPTLYWSLVGALQYLTFTCTNIMYVVQ